MIYRTSLVDATLFPDGYAFPGAFYTDAAGQPQMLGPTVSSYTNDLVIFEVTNKGMMGQATHCTFKIIDGKKRRPSSRGCRLT